MIQGKRTRLRAMERADLPRFVAWLNDPEVTAGLLIFPVISMDQEEQWYQHNLQRPREEQPLIIEICVGENWLPIGDIGLHNISWKDRQAEVGIVIGEKAYWGQGYGSDAMRLMLRHAFQNLNLHRVVLQVFDDNPRAIRSYEKVGFVHEGRLRQDVFKNGQYLDVLVMSILRPEWKDVEI